MHGANRADTCVIGAPAPDTPSSRDPAANTPFLLGRSGFFDKLNMCMDGPDRAAWARRAAGGGGEPPRNGFAFTAAFSAAYQAAGGGGEPPRNG